MTKAKVAALFLGIATLAAAPAANAGGCDSALKVLDNIWQKWGATVKAKGCKDSAECLEKKDKLEASVKEMIAFWNERASGGWATIGPRPLLTGGANNDGKVIVGGARLFVLQAPLDKDTLSFTFEKEGGGEADITVSRHDGKNCLEGKTITFQKNDKKGEKKSVLLSGAKGMLVMVKVDAKGMGAFDYQFTAK